MFRLLLGVMVAMLAINHPTYSQEKKDPPKKADPKPKPKPNVKPTEANVPYGKHPRQVIDFYQAQANAPTPLVLYIHGGGWRAGDKASVGNVKVYLDAGISVAAINYRYVQNGVEEKVSPPVKAPLEDAARALQFIRSKSKEWNIDKTRIGATGGSAGACSSLWLAFHDDMAISKSEDPIARESTRLFCAAVNGAQTTLDPEPLKKWLPNYTYGAHAFGLANFKELYDSREKVLPWIKEYSPMEHVSKDDPPIAMYYGGTKGAKVGEEHPDPTHSPIMGMMLAEKLKETGIPVELQYNGMPNEKHPSISAYLIATLKK
ncbi:MAG: alpha/beta hydrolase [Zavarzinella sp.]